MELTDYERGMDELQKLTHYRTLAKKVLADYHSVAERLDLLDCNGKVFPLHLFSFNSVCNILSDVHLVNTGIYYVPNTQLVQEVMLLSRQEYNKC